MFDVSRLMNEVLGTGGSANLQRGKDYLSKNSGSLAGGAIAGGLAGYMLGSKKGRKIAGKTVQYGGLALVAGLAYKAYRDWQGGKPPAQATHQATPQPDGRSPALESSPEFPLPPANSAFTIDTEKGSSASFGAALVSAMIAAAKADGQIDAAEQEAIFGKIDSLGLSNDEKAFLMDQLRRPLDIDSLVKLAANKEQAVELYVASLMAIEVDSPAEQGYLGMLAARLELEAELVAHIHSSLAEATYA
ncbi:tellurite resistance TerB family protein [Kiloniella laminariae]|uniref:Tellurite resistance TerB family protein n=1 Tax=Kiloniella laminariae TaxID=454162 RepID=A0ABT4LH72_9PROT|nr:tellurite resistance TerB family protein [Kiloniella laminariae]MCZ4280439.1 tellurite resistance TerB family protein [Kiloniella laminariae]